MANARFSRKVSCRGIRTPPKEGIALARISAYKWVESIYKGVKADWLDRSYVPHADRMRAGAHTKIDAYGVIHGACGSPSFDKPGTSCEAQAFLVMMETAHAALNS